MNSRLLQFLNAENITQAQFADSIGVARASISHIISGRNKPSYEFISSMMKQYPQLNPEWLILGKGRMYRDAQMQEKAQAQKTGEIPEESLLFPTDWRTSVHTAEPSLPKTSEETAGDALPTQPGTAGQTVEPMQSGTSGDVLPAQSGTSGQTFQPQQTIRQMVASSAKPRNVSKIIVFFDDGTFQEMRG